MFDHYVALDWAMSNMAIARTTKKKDKVHQIDVPSSISDLKAYLKALKGKICLTLEETTSAHWLYTELREHVDKLLICDPYRNKLLSEGPKTDQIDASKLVQLLKADLLKEVYHSDDKYIMIRKIVSSYEDIIKAGVRLKNQRSAIFRAFNLNHKKEQSLDGEAESFVLEGLDRSIAAYENERKRYQAEFVRLAKISPEIKTIKKISGIGDINAVKIVSRVVDAKRFKTRNHFLSYCGLIKLEKMSGGRSYGKKNPRFCRMMKSVFKTAALAAIGGNNPFNDYYEHLICEKNYTDYNARNAVARRIATIVYGVLKSGKKYEPYRKRINIEEKNTDL